MGALGLYLAPARQFELLKRQPAVSGGGLVGKDGMELRDLPRQRIRGDREFFSYPYTCFDGIACGARYYPYGDEITSTPNERTKFGSYYRDSVTGVDYADQRWYASAYGRFLTPDPSGAGATLTVPASWDLYSYGGGDPVNNYDPTGMYSCGSVDAFADDGDDTDVSNGCSYAGAFGPYSSGIRYYVPCPGYGIGESSLPNQSCATFFPEEDSPGLYDQLGLGTVVAIVPDVDRAHQQLINRTKAELKRALANNPKCQTWLKSGVANGNQATFNKLWNIVTVSAGQFIGGQVNAAFGSQLATSQIEINTNGAFFGTSLGVAYVGSMAKFYEFDPAEYRCGSGIYSFA